MLGLGGPVFALIEAPQRGFSDPLILATLLGGIAAACRLRRSGSCDHAEPMLPLRLFRRRNFTFANLETFTVYAGALDAHASSSCSSSSSSRATRRSGSGLATVPITIVMFVLSPRVGRLSMRFGPRFFMGVGPLVCAASLVWMRRALAGLRLLDDLLPPLLVFAVGLSLIVAPLTSTVLADAGERDAGIASGVNNAIARVAGLLGIAIVGAAIAGSGQPARPARLPDGDGDHRRTDRRWRPDRARRDHERPHA